MEPLAILDGHPIFEGDILYGLDGRPLQARPPNRRDCQLLMKLLEKQPRDPDQWATNTHWKGQQVLFWSAADIPAPKDRNLYCRLKDQLDAKKGRRRDERRG